eukprot:767382-Hanusia_phi.AAC.4
MEDIMTSSLFTVEPAAASSLVVVVQPGDMVSGYTMDAQPVLNLYDRFGNLLTYYSSNSTVVYQISASLSGLAGSALTGTSTVAPESDAIVRFTDLSVLGPVSEDYKLIFTLNGTDLQVSSDVFAVRSFDAIVILRQPANPSFANLPIAVTLQFVDSQGRLAPCDVTIVASLDPLVNYTKLAGNTTLVSYNGVVNFDNLLIEDAVLASPGASIIFEASWNVSRVVTSAYFFVAPGPYNEFTFLVQPPSSVVASRPFDNVASACAYGISPRTATSSGCGPILRMRDSEGVLESKGSTLVQIIQCLECQNPNPLNCLCTSISFPQLPSSCLASNGGCCKAIDQTLPGTLAFPELQLNRPVADLYLMVTRFSDTACTTPYVVSGTQLRIFSAKFRVLSSDYSR